MASRRKNLEVRLIVSDIVIEEQPANVHNRRSFRNNETRYATRYSQDFMANRPFLLESPRSITRSKHSQITIAEPAIGHYLFEQKVGRLAGGYGKRLEKPFNSAELARFNEFKETLTKYVVDGVSFMRTAQKKRCENRHRRHKSSVLIPRSNERGLTILFPSPTKHP